jgi:hypothetical protein
VVDSNMDALAWLRKQLDGDENDLLREMVAEFARRLMAAEVDAVTGAGWGEVSPERVNHRNGYRQRPFDTRIGTVELAIPKLRRGTYFPDWLLDPRRRAEKALVAVVAECYVRGVSTRRVDGLVTVGVTRSLLTAPAIWVAIWICPAGGQQTLPTHGHSSRTVRRRGTRPPCRCRPRPALRRRCPKSI